MSFTITFAFDKAAAHPPGYGYSGPRALDTLRLVVVHSTEGARGSSFASEAIYLRDSPAVSAHYLVGQAGQITRLLDPLWIAWHAGAAMWQGAGAVNARSIGVELHHRAGELYPAVQLAALQWLVRELGTVYPTLEAVASHRAIALPAGRKSDPTNLDDTWLQAACVLR